MKALLVTLLIAVSIFVAANVASAALPPVNQGGGGGWPTCSSSTNGWYFWSGYRWWVCGFSPYYGWIWVPA